MKPKLIIDGARQILTHEKGTEPMLYHGGKRPNAGRKPGTPRKRVTIALSEEARYALSCIKQDYGMSYSTILEQLLTHDTRTNPGTHRRRDPRKDRGALRVDQCKAEPH